MTELMAMAPALTFAAIALGSAFALWRMLTAMSDMFRELSGETAAIEQSAFEPAPQPRCARVVSLPRRPRPVAVPTPSISAKADAPLRAAA